VYQYLSAIVPSGDNGENVDFQTAGNVIDAKTPVDRLKDMVKAVKEGDISEKELAEKLVISVQTVNNKIRV
jgi:transcription initiation factor IIE alpha subunit